MLFRSRARLDRERSDLVATVAHELRSPLTGVKGFVATLLSKWDRLNDDQKKLMLTTVNSDADRLTRLIAELLDVARIDTGRLQLYPRESSAEVLVRRVVDSIEAGTARGISLEVEVDRLELIEPVLAAGVVGTIMLDNFSPDELRQGVALVAGRAVVEASGGITLETIRGVAETGRDLLGEADAVVGVVADDVDLLGIELLGEDGDSRPLDVVVAVAGCAAAGAATRAGSARAAAPTATASTAARSLATPACVPWFDEHAGAMQVEAGEDDVRHCLSVAAAPSRTRCCKAAGSRSCLPSTSPPNRDCCSSRRRSSKSTSKSGIETRSGLRKRSNSRL